MDTLIFFQKCFIINELPLDNIVLYLRMAAIGNSGVLT